MSRKGENIYKRKDGRWEGRYIKSRTASGKAIYGYIYAKTYKEAKEKVSIQRMLQSIPAEISEAETGTEKFDDIAMEWLNAIQPNVKESTGNKYLNSLNSYILPMFQGRKTSELTYDFILEQCNNLLKFGGKKGTGLSPKSVSDVLSILRNILQYAEQHNKVIACDARSIHIGRSQKKDLRVLSLDEQKKLCNYLYSDLNGHNLGILLCLFTGIRIGEVCALTWNDISLSDKTIHIRKTLQRIQNHGGGATKNRIVITSPKSACSIRVIPIPENLVTLLVRYQTVSTGFFMTNSECKFIEPRTMQNHFKAVLKECSIAPANYHALRHTFATRCVELGFDIKSLSEILGHASVNITMNRYVHPTLTLKKENMDRLSALLAVN